LCGTIYRLEETDVPLARKIFKRSENRSILQNGVTQTSISKPRGARGSIVH
jgi:hypothetical protein